MKKEILSELKINSDGKPLEKPNNELSDKNKNSLSFDEYSKEIVIRCKTYMFLNWQSLTTYRLVKKLYNKGYTISDTLSFVILNSNP